MESRFTNPKIVEETMVHPALEHAGTPVWSPHLQKSSIQQPGLTSKDSQDDPDRTPTTDSQDDPDRTPATGQPARTSRASRTSCPYCKADGRTTRLSMSTAHQ